MSSTHSSQSTSSSSSTPLVNSQQSSDETTLLGLTQSWQSIEQGLFNWAQGAYNGLTTLTDPIITDQINTAHTMTGAAQNMLDRYKNVFQPAENQLIGEANSYNSQARQGQEMGAAAARANMATQSAINTSLSTLDSMGVNPSSGRYAGLDLAQNLQGAAIAAGAANQARENVQSVGRGLLGEAVKVGQAYPASAANLTSVGSQASSAAGTLATNRTALGSNMLNQPGQTEASLQSSFKYAPVGQQSQSSSQSTSQGVGVSPVQVPKPLFPDDNQGSSGHGTGTNPDTATTGASGSPTSGQTGGGIGGGTGGGDYAFGGPVRLNRRGGGFVPRSASPSGGTKTDDVQANLNADEYVIPRDVTHHLGTKYFENVIKKSREARGAAQRPIGPKVM